MNTSFPLYALAKSGDKTADGEIVYSNFLLLSIGKRGSEPDECLPLFSTDEAIKAFVAKNSEYRLWKVAQLKTPSELEKVFVDLRKAKDRCQWVKIDPVELVYDKPFGAQHFDDFLQTLDQ